ncbi:hypothetical protein GGE06_007654 [Streptomyces sp. SFB5A]|uniref:Uncharacterized protein n=1 Tax=Streptomyces nymphaeiformis TaxID=2663842 RepID=A0A7W7U892_9ACTN|nr:hypothetical protein [Streptomyces nymphaeiformis]
MHALSMKDRSPAGLFGGGYREMQCLGPGRPA